MENTWYYTLSTISQTLAAILGLAAVFVVLRLQSLIKNIADYRDRALKILKVKARHIRGYDVSDKIDHIYNDIKEFSLNYMHNYRNNGGILNDIRNLASGYDRVLYDDLDFVINTFENLDSFLDQKRGVIKLVKWPGILMALSIAYAIILLSLSDYLNSVYVLWFAVAFALFSFWSALRASWKILDAIKRLE